jgi:hypothetical protein
LVKICPQFFSHLSTRPRSALSRRIEINQHPVNGENTKEKKKKKRKKKKIRTPPSSWSDHLHFD